MVRYGSELAYAPHSINLAGPPVVVYTSDGSTSVDFKLWATDIVGQNVTAGKPVVLSMLLRRHALYVQLAQSLLTD